MCTSTISGRLYYIIIEAIYFLRMVITPMVMMAGGYEAVIGINTYLNNIDSAIFLMSIENVIVFLFLSIISKKEKRYLFKKINSTSYSRPTFRLSLGIAFLAIVIISIIRMDSSIVKATFLFILDTDNTYYALSDSDTGMGTLSMYVEILGSLFKMMQIILPPFLLYFISKIRFYPIKICMTILLLFVICMYATEDRMDAVLAGLAFLMTARDSFDDTFRKIANVLLIGLVCIGIIGVSIKGGVASNGGLLNPRTSSTFASYFSGVPTVAAGLDFVEQEGAFQFYRLVPDAVSKIPYASYLINMFFGIPILNSNQLFNIYLTGEMGYSTGQILPTTILGCRYFGYLFFPIFPIVLILLSRYYCIQISRQNNIIIRNLYYWITISVAISPVLVSGLLIVAKLSWFYITLFFIKSLSK